MYGTPFQRSSITRIHPNDPVNTSCSATYQKRCNPMHAYNIPKLQSQIFGGTSEGTMYDQASSSFTIFSQLNRRIPWTLTAQKKSKRNDEKRSLEAADLLNQQISLRPAFPSLIPHNPTTFDSTSITPLYHPPAPIPSPAPPPPAPASNQT